MGIKASGQLLVGAIMKVPNFEATLDIVTTSNTKFSFQPTFEKVFKANAQISASFSLGLPLGIGVGLEINPLKYRKTAAIYDKPSVGAELVFKANTEGTFGYCQNGIAYEISCECESFDDEVGPC